MSVLETKHKNKAGKNLSANYYQTRY